MSQQIYIIKSKKILEFNAYDHYGRPKFEGFDILIIYFSKYKEGNYYQFKYQFDATYLNSK